MVQINFPKYLVKSNLSIFVKLAEENLKMRVWKYNETCYLKTNVKTVFDYAVDKSKADGDIEVINFTKYMPCILDLTLYIYIYIYMNLKSQKKLLKVYNF